MVGLITPTSLILQYSAEFHAAPAEAALTGGTAGSRKFWLGRRRNDAFAGGFLAILVKNPRKLRWLSHWRELRARQRVNSLERLVKTGQIEGLMRHRGVCALGAPEPLASRF